jgi:hypothetical protein
MTKTKYLLATALLALCISLAAGMASAQVGWSVDDQDLPSDIAWDESYPGYCDALHESGTGQLDPGTYGVASVDGVTAAASVVDRWGAVTAEAPPVYFMSGASVVIDVTITGPALTTLEYTAPVGLTAPGLPLSVDCNWILASPLTPTPALNVDDTFVQDTVVSRFPDVGQTVVGWYYIEQLAGRVPLVVKGYPSGDYAPTVSVDRQQMAIFMARALNLPLLAFVGTFDDVTSDMVAAPYIEALARANIVKGFSPTVYGPTGIVSREQMAIFVSRGMAGGDANVPSGPAVATFSDVATTDVSYKYVEYCAANGVVKGYSPTIYGPLVDVTREQMAIFVWRGFMMATGVPVVIGGPAAVGVQPSLASDLGWSSVHTDPAWGYVALDALRIDWNLAVPDGPTTAWDIVLEVRAASAPTGAAVASTRTELSTANISTLWNAARASGVPYLFVELDLSGLSAGDYILVALVEDSSGVEHEVGWKRAASTYVGRFFPFTVS